MSDLSFGAAPEKAKKRREKRERRAVQRCHVKMVVGLSFLVPHWIGGMWMWYYATLLVTSV